MIHIRTGDISQFNRCLVGRAKVLEVGLNHPKRSFGGRRLKSFKLCDYILNLNYLDPFKVNVYLSSNTFYIILSRKIRRNTTSEPRISDRVRAELNTASIGTSQIQYI